MPPRFNLSANDGTTCIHANSMSNYRPKAVNPLGIVITNTVIGAPVAYKLASGPLRVAGSPRLRGRITTAGADTRAWFALSVGTSPATAQVVQDNLTPYRQLLPVVNHQFVMELAGVAVDV